jgi:hypothetical protein
MSSRQLMKNPPRKGGVKMAKFIDEGFCDKDDPIFTEGITAFTLRRRQPHRPEETSEEACKTSDSPLTHHSEDERQSNG